MPVSKVGQVLVGVTAVASVDVDIVKQEEILPSHDDDIVVVSSKKSALAEIALDKKRHKHHSRTR